MAVVASTIERWQLSRPVPTWCGAVELSEFSVPTAPPRASGQQAYEQARYLIRLHGEPLGFVTVDLKEGLVEESEIYGTALTAFAGRIATHLHGDGLPMVSELYPGAIPPRGQIPACPYAVVDPTTATIVVCTRNRAELLRACLQRLTTIAHPSLEIIIVDNAPSDDTTRAVFDEVVGALDHFRYVREDSPGLSCARNRGVEEARGEVIAFTDDDVTVDQDWVAGLLRGYRRADNVGCVTGLVATATLESPSEYYFDARVTWASSCVPHLYDMEENRYANVLYPYSAGKFGAGANFSMRTSVIRELGGFDEALGAGTRTEGGEDLDIFVRVLLAGYALAYEPASLVWHSHRTEMDALHKQMWGYGTGLTAYLTKHLREPRSRKEILSKVPAGLWKIWKIGDTTRERFGRDYPMPRGLIVRERVGMIAGPLLYVQSRREHPHRGAPTT